LFVRGQKSTHLYNSRTLKKLCQNIIKFVIFWIFFFEMPPCNCILTSSNNVRFVKFWGMKNELGRSF
jgi:hypothetical protein